ncbi:uncharacterized protein LOC117178004 [Belonocnema kinseyi]|uniref:uncharacterized protein LOC117178004 n=1 Tax=Belonocnema kinseyi TaxID=2817044 RepID=UPI00143D6141|nr:uncharacterized protein LOC117178004 [Belonocnema kinseyi]
MEVGTRWSSEQDKTNLESKLKNGCLKGDAAEVLASIELSAENYCVAWELLKERYDNRKIIREGHVKSLLHLPCISIEFPVRSLLDQVQKHIRALKALKESVDSWDTLLVIIIKENLNPFLREKCEDSNNELSQPTYSDIVTFLQKRAQFEDTKSYQQAPVAKNQYSFNKKSFSHSRQESTSSEHPAETATTSKSVTCALANVTSEGLLATAIVDIFNPQGKSKPCRVFLDSGPQLNFITEDTASFPNLRKKSVDISVTGVEYTSTGIKHSVSATMKSRFSKCQKNIDLFVLPRITAKIPSIPINRSEFELPKNITLADPEFHKPSDIDILIGIKLFYKLLCVGQIEFKNHPNVVLQKTQLGWLVAGEINSPSPTTKVQCHLAINSTPLDSSLTKFWEVEEIPKSKLLSAAERACEVHLANDTQGGATGCYIVKLPFNENKEEYETLNHMSFIKNSNSAELGFYLPHHAVVKSNSLTTKIRVVFDGSAKTSSGISLNNSLMVGPTIQDDLFSLLTRFRIDKYALTADIEKMCRQVLVHTDDAVYQKILFRENQNAPIKIYSLNTVTYGTSCASFLTIRALHQLANDEGAQHSIAAAALNQ